MSKLRRLLVSLGVSFAALVLAISIRGLLDPILGNRVPFATVLGAVAAAVGVGGVYPAVAVSVIGYLAASWLFVDPRGSLRLASPADWFMVAGYSFACLSVIVLGLLLRRANRRARAAAAALAELNERKDILLATVAHELRNPLTPIRNAMEMFRQRQASPSQAYLAHDMIDRQLDHLTRLIDDLVDMDSISRDGLELRRRRESLSSVVERAIESCRPHIAAQQQRLTVNLPSAPAYVNVDAERLEQVFVNLLQNASKFTPPEGHIEVTFQLQDGHALVRVKDSGIGLTKQAISRIFEMFYQVDRGQRGLGIGLALVLQLVKLHGGNVTAMSDGLGKGSEFCVSLPIAHAATEPVDQPAEESVAPALESQVPSMVLQSAPHRSRTDLGEVIDAH